MFKKPAIFTLFFALILLAVGLPSSTQAVGLATPTTTITTEAVAGDAPNGGRDTSQAGPDTVVGLLFQQQPGLMAAAVSAGQTLAEYNLPNVTLLVGDGYNLDQYLFKTDGPIAFDLDMQGLVVTVGQPMTLVLSVFDVDQNGVSTCAPEVDKVYINDHYLGNLSGANDQWSVAAFAVSAEKLNPTINHIRVDAAAAGVRFACHYLVQIAPTMEYLL